MKTSIVVVAICLLAGLLPGCFGQVGRTSREAVQPPGPADVFDMLDPYGTWMTIPVLGEVWQPRVPYDWAPYRYGRWEWTDRGWMWVGEEKFGWVVYHYGFWDYRDDVGWFWIPGYDWFPARVAWRMDDQMIGWSPVPPPGETVPRPEADVQGRWWTFVTPRDFSRPAVNTHRYRGRPQFGLLSSSRSPDVGEIEAVQGERVPRLQTEVERVQRHGRNLERVGTRAEPPQGVSPPPPNPPGLEPPTNLPVGHERGREPGPPPESPAKTPERKEPRRLPRPSQPSPGTEHRSRDGQQTKPPSVNQERPLPQDTVKAVQPNTRSTGRRR
jgi:hypothetical protein